MRNRKPSNYETEEKAKELLRNEILIRKACLATAKNKVVELKEKIESGNTSKKVQKELEKQTEIALDTMNWLKSKGVAV